MKKQQFIPTLLGICLSTASILTSEAYGATSTSSATSTTDFQSTLTTLFTNIDTNQDSYLSFAEMETWHDTQQLERFTALDTDSSNSLSLAELQATTTQNGFPDNITENYFKLLDSDNNSVLSPEEFALMAPGKGERIRHFAHMDSDGDLQISQTEFLSAPGPGKPGNHHDR
jgi:Ca2+-binding EF-hand superfamily protein